MDIKELKQEEEVLKNKLHNVRNKIVNLERAAIRPDLEKTFVGKFFKTHNSYSGDDKGWWHYHYVIALSGRDFNVPNPTFRVFSFQVTTSKHVDVEFEDWYYQSSLGQEITRNEFIKAYNGMLKKIEFKENLPIPVTPDGGR